MANRKYSDETKEQIVKECRKIGNTALVARRHNISKIKKENLKKVLLKVLKNNNDNNNKISMRAYQTIKQKYSIEQWVEKIIKIKKKV